jgi:hypothetical protein
MGKSEATMRKVSLTAMQSGLDQQDVCNQEAGQLMGYQYGREDGVHMD